MAYLLDTSLLARLANSADAQHSIAVKAVLELHRRREVLHVSPQVLVEFRSVATRPIEANGLGLTAAEAAFGLLADTPEIYPAWKQLVEGLGIIGKQVHDARIMAACHVHSVTHLLTFNAAHFDRMTGFDPIVVVVNPKTI